MRFQFRPVLTICMLIGLAVLVSLGNWQVQRLSWKRDLIAKVEARTSAEPIPFADAYKRWLDGEDMEYTPVQAKLIYDHAREAHVFGTSDGTIGWYIFAPTYFCDTQPDHVDAAAVLYVNRGFAPEAFKRSATRADSLTGPDVEGEYPVIIGLLRTPQKTPGYTKSLIPENNPAENEWHTRDPLAFAEAAELQALPVWIDSAGLENPADWPRGGTTRLQFNNRHLEYALTWFGLALTLLGVYVAFSLKREK